MANCVMDVISLQQLHPSRVGFGKPENREDYNVMDTLVLRVQYGGNMKRSLKDVVRVFKRGNPPNGMSLVT
jgi:hypothetical protein